MNKWILTALVVVVGWCGWLPFEAVDAGKLYVVETLMVEQVGHGVNLAAGDVQGSGKTVEEALEMLQRNAPGTVFLRQTRRVILCGGYNIDIETLPDVLPVGAAVYETAEDAQALQEQEKLDEILSARERREEYVTLAAVKNGILSGEKVELEEIP